MRNAREIKQHKVHQAILRGMDYTYASRRDLIGEATCHAFNVLVADWIMRRLDDGFDVNAMVDDLNAVVSNLSSIRRAMLAARIEADIVESRPSC